MKGYLARFLYRSKLCWSENAEIGEILNERVHCPMRLRQGALAEAMGVQRKHVNELCKMAGAAPLKVA
jgi:plasmid maintenance system antidote protein VapI